MRQIGRTRRSKTANSTKAVQNLLLALCDVLSLHGDDVDRVIAALRTLAADALDADLQHKKHIRRRSPRAARDASELASLTLQEVEDAIKDDASSKEDLLDLASARFSMSRSQLRRLRAPDVRAAIHTAVLHESSIQILSEQASREGSTRSS